MSTTRSLTLLALPLAAGLLLALPSRADDCPGGAPPPGPRAPARPDGVAPRPAVDVDGTDPRAQGAMPAGHGIPSTPTGKAFATPQEAGQAFLAALEADGTGALKELLGEGSDDVLFEESDPVAAKRRADVAAMGRAALEVREDGERRVLVFGDDGWELPLPLAKTPEGWRFDLAAAHEAIHARVIGRNELDALSLLAAYGTLQETYFAEDRDDDGVREYAQRLISTQGRQDGLWWPAQDGEAESPLAGVLEPLVGDEQELEAGAPFAGYRWRTLLAQGPGARGRGFSYVMDDDMVAGYALVAWPAEYRKTGVQTFLVSRNGVVFQKDLGPETAARAKAIKDFAPDAGWTRVDLTREFHPARTAVAGVQGPAPKAD
jgi:hypothetical protein